MQRNLGFRQLLTISLGGLALASTVFTVVSMFLIDEAKQRVLNGRLASDGLAALQESQIQLRQLELVWLEYTAATTRTDLPFSALAALPVERLDDLLAELQALHTALAQADQGEAYTSALGQTVALQLKWKDVRQATMLPASVLTMDEQAIAKQQMSSKIATFSNLLDTSVGQEKVRIDQKRTDADSYLTALYHSALIAALSFVGLCFGLSWLLRERLSRQITAIERGIEKIERGELASPIQVLRNDEFGRLSTTVNQLATTLLASNAREEQLRHDLEATVGSRTEELARALEQTKQVSFQRNQLFAEVGHELRTPLTVIRGEADLLLRQREPQLEPLRPQLETIRTAGKQLTRLVEDLFSIAHDDDPSMTINVAAGCPDHSVHSAVGLLGSERGRVDVSTGAATATCNFDAFRLQQVILTLLENALSYSDSSERVLVQTGHNRTVWELTVSDHGNGIQAEDLKSVFERGFRSEMAINSRPRGLGLGLYIAKSLVERQGGSISISSKWPSRGTTVSVTLPLCSINTGQFS